MAVSHRARCPAACTLTSTTWHLINTVYQPQRMAELRSMIDFYGNPVHHQRLMKVVRERLGHALRGVPKPPRSRWPKAVTPTST